MTLQTLFLLLLSRCMQALTLCKIYTLCEMRESINRNQLPINNHLNILPHFPYAYGVFKIIFRATHKSIREYTHSAFHKYCQ